MASFFFFFFFLLCVVTASSILLSGLVEADLKFSSALELASSKISSGHDRFLFRDRTSPKSSDPSIVGCEGVALKVTV
ncbi:hypothetical protein BDV23DRAFT_158284 [Aspergillus alliaceus]|uniref:Uncharacterized protein n=1 Tax=Petromyces alliaceus TaxID=209559 RepID=A0A5N7C5A7_PETAA|nr:hypothetical protein BDV23DRAFT_158284 [Aspergillus alliaceus]